MRSNHQTHSYWEIRLLASIAVVCMAWSQSIAGENEPEPGALEQIEEQTESFANALLDLSVAVREKDFGKIAPYFAPEVFGTVFPSVPGKLQPDHKWIQRRDWSFASTSSTHSRQEMTHSFRGLLANFPTIQDARFKVKASVVKPKDGTIEAKIALWLIARNQQGHREWLRGRAKVVARRDRDEHWQMSKFVLTELDSMISDRDLFDEVSRPAGLNAQSPLFLDRTDQRFAAYGVAVADVNGDGFIDALVTSAKGNSLYLNRGDGTFQDQAEQAFVKRLPVTGISPLFLDYDNDGDTDIFISTIGEQLLFESRLIPDGRLEFWDNSAAAGVAIGAIGFSAVAGDINRDGYPDIYVASYNRYGEVLPDHWDGATNGTKNLLFISQGDGTFKEMADRWGVADGRWSYAAQFADFDDDGDLDLYVANDYGGGNALYLNEGSHFRDAATERGVVDRGYGMGVSFGDYDNDGDLDLHVSRMSSTAGNRILARMNTKELPKKDALAIMAAGNALYQNTGQGFFVDVIESAGPFSGGWAWGGGFFDLDNDGWQDLYTPNGFISGKSLKDT